MYQRLNLFLHRIISKYLFIKIIFILLANILLFSPLIKASSEEINIIYFSVPLCSNCSKMETSLSKINSQHKNIKILKYDISKENNLSIFNNYLDYYKVPNEKRVVPIIFISDKYFENYDSIESNIGELLKNHDLTKTPLLSSEMTKENIPVYDIISFMLAGFLNGINPCSISMLLFFISLATLKDVGIKKLGFSFIIGKFLTYLLIGSILYKTLSNFNLSTYNFGIKIIFSIFSLTLIFLNLKDYFNIKNQNYGNIKNQLPSKLRKFNHNIIKNFLENKVGYTLLIICFFIGVITSLGEFLCTGQIYLASLSYMINSYSYKSISAIFYLLLYVTCFVTPSVLVILLIDKGMDTFTLSGFFMNKLHVIKLLNAVIIFIFWIFILFIL